MKPPACAVLLLAMSVPACQPGNAGQAAMDAGMARELREAAAEEAEAAAIRAARESRKNARSHELLGIDFARPLHLPRCAKYYDKFDRPDRTCMYVNDGGRPFKIEFQIGAVPEFVKWQSASISTDRRGFPRRMHFDVSLDPSLQGDAVDAMLERFGPPTWVTPNSGPKVGRWEHEDYVIQQFLDPDGPFVQMDTRKSYDAALAESSTDAAASKAGL